MRDGLKEPLRTFVEMHEKGGSTWQHQQAASVLDAPFVELFADPSKLTRALEAARKQVLAFGKVVGTIGLGAAGAGASLLTPIAKLFTDAVNEGTDVQKLAQQYGTTAEKISTLRGAFAQAGVGAGDFAGAMESLAAKISHAADSGGPLLDSLQSLGTGRDFMGKGIDEQFDLIAERIKAIPSAIDQMRAANEMGLGSMLPLLKKGKAGLDELRAAAIANGDAMSGEQAAQAAEIQKEFNRTLLAGKSTLLEVGKALIPTGASFSSVGADIRESLKSVRDWIRDNKQNVVAVTAAAAALLAGGAAVAAFGAAVAVVAPIIGGLIVAIKAAVAVAGAILSPVGLVVIAVAAAAAGLAYLWSQTEQGKFVLGELKDAFTDVVKWFKSGFAAIGDAFKAGDWSLAFKVGVAMAKEAWAAFVFKLTAGWVAFKELFVDGWDAAVTGVKKVFIDLAAFILRNVESAIHGIVDAFNSIAPDSLKIKIAPKLSDEDINAARDLLKDKEDKAHRDRKAKRDEFRSNQASDAYANWDDAWKELEDLKREAKEAAEKQYGGLFNRIGRLVKDTPKSGAGAGPPSMQALAAAAKGMFSGSAQQQLGYGDQLGQRQLDAANNTASNTAAALTVLESIRDKPAGIVLK